MTDQADTPLYDFHMRVASKDPEGYYHVRWDQATPLVVRAANRPEAFTKAWAVMGPAPRYRTWTAQIDRIETAARAEGAEPMSADQADTPDPIGELRDDRGYFEGFAGRECGEHRTVGDYRAWCYDCGEWCYPSEPSERCGEGRDASACDERPRCPVSGAPMVRGDNEWHCLTCDPTGGEELWALAVDELRRRNLGRIADHFAAALAELAAARDQIAAVRALAATPDHECGEICEAIAALSQSGQPTKGEPA